MVGLFHRQWLFVVVVALLQAGPSFAHAKVKGSASPSSSPSPSPSALPSPTPSLIPVPSYDTRVPPQEVRATLNGLLDDIDSQDARGESASEDPAIDSYIMKLVGSYRAKGEAGSTAIKDAPYFNFLIGQLNDSYATEYASYYKQYYQTDVGTLLNADLVTLFNTAMDMIAAHQVWEAAVKKCPAKAKDGSCPSAGDEPTTFDALQQAENSLGTCLVARVRAEASDKSCVLDPDPTHPVKHHNIISQAWMKLSCGFHGQGECSVRREVYDLFKPKLMALKTPDGQKQIDQAFSGAFPATFRKQYLSAIAEEESQVPVIVAQKFGASGTSTALFDANTALIELDAPTTKRLTMASFAQGLRADLGAAERLQNMQGADAEQAHTMAAALFYAAANRLLLMSGFTAPIWNGTGMSVDPKDSLDAKHPDQAPKLMTRTFGGYGMGKSATPGLAPQFSVWDLANYNPSAGGFRIFPQAFELDSTDSPVQGTATMDPQNPAIPPAESFDDLAELLGALSDFIALTGPHGAFASHLVDMSKFSLSDFGTILLDPKQPGLFPTSGRQLAIGLAGAVLQNLVLAPLAHVDQSQSRPVFYPSVTLDGRVAGPVTIAEISRVVLAARTFRRVLDGDPDAPDAVTSHFKDIDLAIQGIATILGAQEQCSDGGFNAIYGEPCGELGGPDDHRLLESTELAVRVMMAAYVDYPGLRNVLLKLSIRNGWQFLDGYWTGADIIPAEERGLPPQPVDASALWDLQNLWNDSFAVSRGEVLPAVRADLASEVKWAVWDSRAQALRQRLLGQLATPNGPQPVSP